MQQLLHIASSKIGNTCDETTAILVKLAAGSYLFGSEQSQISGIKGSSLEPDSASRLKLGSRTELHVF